MALATPPLISPMACGEIAFRRDSRRGGPFSVIPAAAAVSNAASRLSGMDVSEGCERRSSERCGARINEFKLAVSFPLLPHSSPRRRESTKSTLL